MDQEKRLLLAFVLSFGLLLGWRAFFVKTPPPKTAQHPTTLAPPPLKPAQASINPTPAGQSVARKSRARKPVVIPVEKGAAAREVVGEGDLYRVTFSNQGAVVRAGY
jgi:YidC/Oxa1 family membrane protein insertase